MHITHYKEPPTEEITHIRTKICIFESYLFIQSKCFLSHQITGTLSFYCQSKFQLHCTILLSLKKLVSHDTAFSLSRMKTVWNKNLSLSLYVFLMCFTIHHVPHVHHAPPRVLHPLHLWNHLHHRHHHLPHLQFHFL